MPLISGYPKKRKKKNGRFTRTGRTKYSLAREYEFNEDRNAHTENLWLLTENYGTAAERRKMRPVIRRRQKGYSIGETGDYTWDEYEKEQTWALDTTNPYYYKHVRGAKEKSGRGGSLGLGGNTEYGKLF